MLRSVHAHLSDRREANQFRARIGCALTSAVPADVSGLGARPFARARVESPDMSRESRCWPMLHADF
jgi:hypothetical protein